MRKPTNEWNPEFKFHRQRIRNMIRDLPKKKLTKVLQRLLSDILKREDDYIETSLIEEKVRLTVK